MHAPTRRRTLLGIVALLPLTAASVPARAPVNPDGATAIYVVLHTAAGDPLKPHNQTARGQAFEAMSFSITTPHGGATPVAHLRLDVEDTPQLLHALLLSEALQRVTITINGGSRNAAPSVMHVITATRGYIVGTSVSARAGGARIVDVDLLLAGTVTFTRGVLGLDGSVSQVPSTNLPPSVDLVVDRTGTIVRGHFMAQHAGPLPRPASSSPPDISLDGISFRAFMNVSGGAPAGHVLVGPVTVLHPSAENIAYFGAVESQHDVFSKIELLVIPTAHPSIPTLKIVLEDACIEGPRGVCGVTSPSGTGGSAGAGASRTDAGYGHSTPPQLPKAGVSSAMSMQVVKITVEYHDPNPSRNQSVSYDANLNRVM